MAADVRANGGRENLKAKPGDALKSELRHAHDLIARHGHRALRKMHGR